MVKVWRVTLLSLLFTVILSSAAAAQEPVPSQPRPLLMSAVHDRRFIIGHDLYRFAGGEWEAVTSDGFKGGFRLSPTGFIMAVQAVPDAIRAANLGWLLGAAWDLRLLDLTTGESRLIAGQPPDFVVDSDGQTTRGITRSLPVWSPDGTALAWAEQDYPADGPARLMVYDLISGDTRTLDAEVPQVTMSENGLPTGLSWGDRGLVLFTNDAETGVETLRFYDPESGLQQVISHPDEMGEAWQPLTEPQWVTIEGAGEQVVVRAAPWLWWRVDPVSGAVAQFCGVLEGVSAASPDSSLRVIWDTALAGADGEWRLVTADGVEVKAFGAGDLPGMPGGQGIVLSPDGPGAAYTDQESVLIDAEDGFAATGIPADLSNLQLYWGQLEWRSESAPDQSCAIG